MRSVVLDWNIGEVAQCPIQLLTLQMSGFWFFCHGCNESLLRHDIINIIWLQTAICFGRRGEIKFYFIFTSLIGTCVATAFIPVRAPTGVCTKKKSLKSQAEKKLEKKTWKTWKKTWKNLKKLIKFFSSWRACARFTNFTRTHMRDLLTSHAQKFTRKKH